MDKNSEIDKYSHRLSIRNNICYENALDIMKNSLKVLGNKDYEFDNIIRSAYKYSKKDIQDGGYNTNNKYKIKYLKYKYKYLELKKIEF